jgi:hypothetical protein
VSFFARIRTKLRTFGAAQDEALKRLVRAGLGFLLVPLLLTLALSAAGFLVFHPSLAGPLDTNKLPPDERARAVRWLAGTAAACSASTSPSPSVAGSSRSSASCPGGCA